MQILKQLTAFLLFALAGVGAQPPKLASSKQPPKPYSSAREIIRWFNGNSTSSPSAKAYIDAAVGLQSLPFHQAVLVLYQLSDAANSRELSGLPRFGGTDVFVLPRMLFKAKPGGEFRKPARGGETPLVSPPPSDWSLSPIVIVDGVPFVIPAVITLTGQPGESPKSYLNYCFANCDWNDFQSTQKSQRQLQQALDKLLAQLEDGTHMSDYARQAIAAQIQ